jgi:hypothetical protein
MTQPDRATKTRHISLTELPAGSTSAANPTSPTSRSRRAERQCRTVWQTDTSVSVKRSSW